ncbi:hypothetical protein [Paenibacillus sinopodophylli]|uniref:hypothetical protein n=1 Tax=Paenibacillus sinopodophylli TaxID=1837342 RepID=UPI00148624D8|nr:hypothetical protein [Paenibacillus sinopodophylli]
MRSIIEAKADAVTHLNQLYKFLFSSEVSAEHIGWLNLEIAELERDIVRQEAIAI